MLLTALIHFSKEQPTKAFLIGITSLALLSLPVIFVSLNTVHDNRGRASTGWQLVWGDDFNGSSVDTNKWNISSGQGDTCNVFTPSKVSVSAGQLHLANTYVGGSNFYQTHQAGRVTSESKFTFTYGKIEWRAKMPGPDNNLGYWPGLWLSQQNNTIDFDEVDVVEMFGPSVSPIYQSHITFHPPNYSITDFQTHPYSAIHPADGFHIYTLIWDQTSLKYYVDNVLSTTFNNGDNGLFTPDQPLYVLISNLMGASNQTTYPGVTIDPSTDCPTGGAPFPNTISGQTVDVDYVRVYQMQTKADVDLKVNGSDGPVNIGYNTSVKLTWTTQDAATCQASDGWSGSQVVNGSFTTANLTTTKTFTLACGGAGVNSSSDSVTVTVAPAPGSTTPTTTPTKTTSPITKTITNPNTGPVNTTPLTASPVSQNPATPTQTPAKSYKLDIKVLDEQNKPVKGAQVKIVGQKELVTSSLGIASFNLQASGVYQVSIKFQNETVNKDVILTPRTFGSTQVLSIHIDRQNFLPYQVAFFFFIGVLVIMLSKLYFIKLLRR